MCTLDYLSITFCNTIDKLKMVSDKGRKTPILNARDKSDIFSPFNKV